MQDQLDALKNWADSASAGAMAYATRIDQMFANWGNLSASIVGSVRFNITLVSKNYTSYGLLAASYGNGYLYYLVYNGSNWSIFKLNMTSA